MYRPRSDWFASIQLNNQYDLSNFMPWFYRQKLFGWVRRDRIATLQEAVPYLFERHCDVLTLSESTAEQRQKNFDLLAARLAGQGETSPLRHEPYKVARSWSEAPIATVDRVTAPYLGIRAYGVHVIGYVEREDDLYLWVAKRALDRFIEPGKLDTMVGGGQPAGLGLKENVLKESYEEAGLSEVHLSNLRSVGAVSYVREDDLGLKPDTMFLFDLPMPEGVCPQNTDGEVAGFSLMPAKEVASLVREGSVFKKNCHLVYLDFFIRHGLISPEEADYIALQQGLRQTLPEPPFPV